MNFDAEKELEALRERNPDARARRPWQSKLGRYRAELVALRRAGASYRELSLWLRQTKRMKVAPSTIMRFLRKLPEVKGSA